MASFDMLAAMDKENSKPNNDHTPKKKTIETGIRSPLATRSPAKAPLADIQNFAVFSPKGKGVMKSDLVSKVDLKGTPTKLSSALSGRTSVSGTPVKVRESCSNGTPVKSIASLWLERQNSMKENTSTDQSISPDTDGQVAACLPHLTSDLANVLPDVEGGAEVLPTTVLTEVMGATSDGLAEAATDANPPATVKEPEPQPQPEPQPSGDATNEITSVPAPPIARPSSFLFSPKAKPFYPRSMPGPSTPLSPKAKPFFPKELAPIDVPINAPHRILEMPSLTSPVMAPLMRPPVLTSPFTPSSRTRDLSKMSSSNLLAPTREQARAHEVTRLEALWIRRTTPVKPGEKPLSPCGNVLTSPETWSAVNWWSPCNKPRRHSAVQVDPPSCESKETETPAQPKKLFSDSDTMTDPLMRLTSDYMSEVDFEFTRVDTIDSETMTMSSSLDKEASELYSTPKWTAVRHRVAHHTKPHKIKEWLRPLRSSKVPTAVLFAKKVRKEVLRRQATLALQSTTCKDTAPSEEVADACQELEGPMEDLSPCYSLQTAVSPDHSPSSEDASPVAVATILQSGDGQPTIHNKPGTRIIIRLPHAKPKGRQSKIGSGGDAEEQSPKSETAVQIKAGSVTIDVYR